MMQIYVFELIYTIVLFSFKPYINADCLFSNHYIFETYLH